MQTVIQYMAMYSKRRVEIHTESRMKFKVFFQYHPMTGNILRQVFKLDEPYRLLTPLSITTTPSSVASTTDNKVPST